MLFVAARLAGCAAAVPHPGERELAEARRFDAAVTAADLARGRDLYVAKCSGCHPLHGVDERSDAEWEATLAEMREKARLDADSERPLRLYLLGSNGR